MASTYSQNLKIELIGTGEQSGTWGTTTNTNLGTALEQAIVGYGSPNFASDADLTISLSDSNATQTARNFSLRVTSGVSLTTTRNLIVPTIQKPYLIFNDTTGGQSIIVKTSAGAGVTVPNGARTLVYVDGTNVVSQITSLGSALPATSGGTGQSSYAVGDLLYASTTTALSKLADVATGNALISGGVGVAPAWGKVGLTTHITGTLPVANGGTGSTSLSANNVLLGNGTSAVQVVAPGNSGNVLQSDGTTWASTAKLVLATQQASTSGTNIDFTSIPAWVKRITIMFDGVSTNGTNLLFVQIGDSGGIETNGYTSFTLGVAAGSTGATGTSTSAFLIISSWLSTRPVTGALVLSLMDAASNQWVASGVLNDTAVGWSPSGVKSLSAALDRIRITTNGGTDTFDAGNINILYE